MIVLCATCKSYQILLNLHHELYIVPFSTPVHQFQNLFNIFIPRCGTYGTCGLLSRRSNVTPPSTNWQYQTNPITPSQYLSITDMSDFMIYRSVDLIDFSCFIEYLQCNLASLDVPFLIVLPCNLKFQNIVRKRLSRLTRDMNTATGS